MARLTSLPTNLDTSELRIQQNQMEIRAYLGLIFWMETPRLVERGEFGLSGFLSTFNSIEHTWEKSSGNPLLSRSANMEANTPGHSGRHKKGIRIPKKDKSFHFPVSPFDNRVTASVLRFTIGRPVTCNAVKKKQWTKAQVSSQYRET